jgi:hypothetical protein
MRFSRVRMLAATGVVVVASTIAGTAIAASAAPASSSLPVLVQCNVKGNPGQVKPKSTYQPSCMPSNTDITSMKWSTWTSSSAFGSVLVGYNDCTPSAKCGPPGFTKFPALIVLWRPAAWPHHVGRQYFTRMTLIFNGSGKHFPAGSKAVQTSTLLAAQP